MRSKRTSLNEHTCAAQCMQLPILSVPPSELGQTIFTQRTQPAAYDLICLILLKVAKVQHAILLAAKLPSGGGGCGGKLAPDELLSNFRSTTATTSTDDVLPTEIQKAISALRDEHQSKHGCPLLPDFPRAIHILPHLAPSPGNGCWAHKVHV